MYVGLIIIQKNMYQKLSYYPPLNFNPNQLPYCQPQFLLPNQPLLYLNPAQIVNPPICEIPIQLGNAVDIQSPFENNSYKVPTDTVFEKEEGKKNFKKKKTTKRNMQKEITSAKKNSESNIINQFFSFYGSRAKSEKKLQSVLTYLSESPASKEKIVMMFYLAMKTLNIKRRKRYINKTILFSMFDLEYLESCQELSWKGRSLGVELEMIGKMLRLCIGSFLKDFCIGGILTSKRIGDGAKYEHLRRRRNIMSTFMKN